MKVLMCKLRNEIKKFLVKMPVLHRIIFSIATFFVGCFYYIRYGHYDPREYNVSEEKKLVYLNNAKVACSSFKAGMFPIDAADDYSIHAATERFRQRSLNKEQQSYFKFTFVRNPYERLVSCYESKYHTDKDKHHRKVLYYDYYFFGCIRKDKGFTNFVRRICRIPDQFADRHFCSQYGLVYDTKKGVETCVLDFVGKYETMAQDYQKIQERFSLKVLPHFNKSAKKNWMDYYTLETAERVHNKYKKDFKKFGYEQKYEELIQYLKTKESREIREAK